MIIYLFWVLWPAVHWARWCGGWGYGGKAVKVPSGSLHPTRTWIFIMLETEKQGRGSWERVLQAEGTAGAKALRWEPGACEKQHGGLSWSREEEGWGGTWSPRSHRAWVERSQVSRLGQGCKNVFYMRWEVREGSEQGSDVFQKDHSREK